MNTHDIELPPLPPGYTSYEFPDGGYDADEMQAYACAAIEADRKRRQKPALTAEKIRIIWKETMASMGDGGDPVLRFARAIERAHGISAPQPAEPDLVRCAECGAELIQVRPGKWQHPDCSQSSWAAEPVKVPSDAELLTCTGVSKHGDMPAIFGTADIRRFAECILKHFGQRPAEPVKVPIDDLAHEIWAAAQTAPGEGIADGVARIEALLRKVTHPAITHCESCGCDWLDNGLNPAWCPYCKISALREALKMMVEMVEMNGFGRAYAMKVARAALAQGQGGRDAA